MKKIHNTFQSFPALQADLNGLEELVTNDDIICCTLFASCQVGGGIQGPSQQPTPTSLHVSSPSHMSPPHPSCLLPIPHVSSPSLMSPPHPSCLLPIPHVSSPPLMSPPHPSCLLPIPHVSSPSLMSPPLPSTLLPFHSSTHTL